MKKPEVKNLETVTLSIKSSAKVDTELCVQRKRKCERGKGENYFLGDVAYPCLVVNTYV
jgi:hypothetical protein